MKAIILIFALIISVNCFGQFVRKPIKTTLVSYDLKQPTPSTWKDPKVYIGFAVVSSTFITNRYACKDMTEGQQALVFIGGAATLWLSCTIFDAIKDHKHKNRYKKCRKIY